MTFPVTFPSRPHFPACSLREIIKTHPERGNSRLQRFLIRFGDTLRTALSGSLICSSLFLFFPSDHKQKDRSTFPPWVEEIFFFFVFPDPCRLYCMGEVPPGKLPQTSISANARENKKRASSPGIWALATATWGKYACGSQGQDSDFV